MGLPAKRRTKQSKRERASHFALKSFSLVTCSHCHRQIAPHRVCRYCGYYKGREVITMKIAAPKKKAVKAEPEKKSANASSST